MAISIFSFPLQKKFSKIFDLQLYKATSLPRLRGGWPKATPLSLEATKSPYKVVKKTAYREKKLHTEGVATLNFLL